jgi:glycosyltransferase involved in cell wall biosynthesis
MKILLANKFYYCRGGAEVYVINLAGLLRACGHEVAVFAMQYPENLPTAYEAYFPKQVDFAHVRLRDFFTYVARPLGWGEVRNRCSRLLEAFRPDVVHLNNVHSQLSPVIAEMAHARGVRVVWTLHDYKLLCPCYLCMREERPCDLCYTEKWAVVRYSCLKNSRLASLLAYLEAKKWNRERMEECTTAFICPSDFLRSEMIRGGFHAQKLAKLNNFIDVGKITQPVCTERENYYCYVGRLSPEKGMETLLKAAAGLPYKLRIIGSGLLEQELKRRYGGGNIVFEGHKPWSEIEAIAGKALFSVIASEWLENNPIATLESLALGTPVLGARIGGIPELIEEGTNGLLFESGNGEDLKAKIRVLFERSIPFDYEAIAREARGKYSAESHLQSLLEIYKR